MILILTQFRIPVNLPRYLSTLSIVGFSITHPAMRPFPEKTFCRIWLLLTGAALLLPGCATTQFVELREKPHNPLMERLQSTKIGQLRPSDRTERFLAATDYRGPRNPGNLIQHTRRCLKIHTDSEALHALAEINYLGSQETSHKDAYLSDELLLDSAQAAWRYFTRPDELGQLPSPADDQHRSTAEVYNASCEALIRSVRNRNRNFRLGHAIRMPLTNRVLQFEIPFESNQLDYEHLSEFELASDYRLKNLRNHHRRSGLGVPIIAGRRSSQAEARVEQYYTKGMSCAGTMILRFSDDHFSDGITEPDSSPPEFHSCRLQLHDPRESDGFVVGETLLPLETDLSTPLASFLSNPDLKLLDTWGFLRPDRAHSVAGLYMVQPYDPDRIPVLMVHGLWSSPMTWMEMFNDLQADPEILRRYQFWFYLYPTGEPLAFSAAHLREELDQVRKDCDPSLSNRNLDSMVVVGHSMGGLISHMLTIDSSDRLWNSVSRIPVEQIRAREEEKSEIRRVFFFQSNASVQRIVTIASPYGGSRYSNPFTRWLSGTLIFLPSRTLQLTRLVSEQNQSGWWERFWTPRTSLDSLTKKSAVLTLIRDTRVPNDVKHHNIVGVSKGKSREDWTDGVVSFRSAHRSEAASEVTIRASHSEVHRHPDSIAEVRRILIEHLDETRQQRYPVVPVRQLRTTSRSGTESSTILTQ
jgi:pimeloyl-ACP methyl ester carboxylesterase